MDYTLLGFNVLTLVYIIASVTFILGLKMLSHPETARRGNLIAAAGMTLAIFGTVFLYKDELGNKLHNYAWIFGGLVIGGIVGVLSAKKVKMTAMPEMVSMFNGMGGACAALISINEFRHLQHQDFFLVRAVVPDPNDFSVAAEGVGVPAGVLITIFLGLIIGSVSFAGSMIAWGKLNGKIKDFAFPRISTTSVVLNSLFASSISCSFS